VVRRLTAFLIAACLAPLAWAANKDTERLQIQIANLQAQMSELQRRSDDSLKEIKRLNELLADQGAQARKNAQDRQAREEAWQLALKDITDRLGEINEKLSSQPPQAMAASAYGNSPSPTGEPSAGPAGSAPNTGAVATPPVAGAAAPAPRELYSQAYADYARGNYDLAIQGFQEYLRTYPNTEFSDNGQYWIGECLYGKQKYAEAIEAWNVLFRDFPSSDKLPDARFKKGLALERLGRRSQALVEYRYVIDRYPNSEAGRKAREKLNAQ
jgi:tol-pal system protein YbgF